MKVKEIYLQGISFCILFFLIVLSKLAFVYSISIAFSCYMLFRFVNNLGNTFAFFDFLIFYACVDTLLMPIFGYEVYNRSSHTASIWGKIMSVPRDTYYLFILPCNVMLFLVLKNVSTKIDFYKLSNQLHIYLKEKGKIGIAFTAIGILTGFIHPYLPRVLDAIIGVFIYLKFIGPMYIYFSNLNFKIYYLIGAVVLMFVEALTTGMFGELLNNLLLITVVIGALVKMSSKFSFITKLSTFIFVMFLVLVLQSVKPLYRLVTWKKQTIEGYSLSTHGSGEIFRNLFLSRLSNPNRIFDKETMFGPYVRFNHGILIAATMDYVPRVKPYANGSTISRQLISIAVPRLFYEDKYEAGGVENMLRFTGTKLNGVSMNVGIFGEFYGNYGSFGGLIGVGCYALILYLTWRLILNRIKSNIEWVLWIPNLYYYCLTVETDLFTTLNTFVKSFIVVFFILYMLRNSTSKV